MSKSLLLVATLFPTAITLVALLGSSSQAHRSGCHRWYSCESDRDSDGVACE